MHKSEFTYELPEDRIAVAPLKIRDQSKLLVYKNDGIEDKKFTDLPEVLPDNTLLFFNNTRVVKARLHFTKTEGAKPIEIFCLTPHAQSVEESMNAVGSVKFECLVGNLKRWKDHPLHLQLPDGTELTAVRGDRVGPIFVIHFTWNSLQPFSEILECAGKIPLPPYMNREAASSDEERYQTVYAKSNGSVAAPTAGLHFTPKVFNALKTKGHQWQEITLHVGAGTFKPLEDGPVNNHEMHAEEILLSTNWLDKFLTHEGPVFAVGTTSLRTLESCHWLGAHLLEGRSLQSLGQFDAYELPQNYTAHQTFKALRDELTMLGISEIAVKTQLMIKPGYSFKTVNGLVTNFHQPGSTLLLLVSAGVGDDWRNIYTHALENEYRFLSYGDSSVLYFK
jgi:S-adenosylmethionine:tRNA ribosyltransferase-isomerase